MKKLICVILLYSSVIFAQNSLELQKYKGDYFPEVNLELTIDKIKCKTIDSLNLTYIFRNTSKAYPLAYWDFFWKDCYLIIKDEKDTEVSPIFYLHSQPPETRPENFHFLNPNQFIGMTKMLRFKEQGEIEYYPLTPGKTYSIYCSLSVYRRDELRIYYNSLTKAGKKRIRNIMENFLAFNYIKDKNNNIKAIEKYYTFDTVWEGDIKSNIVYVTIAE